MPAYDAVVVGAGPNGLAAAIVLAQIERFAPGFREIILVRHTLSPAALERHDPNLVGGDIAGGANTLLQTLFRPTFGCSPYRTPVPGVYLCSASTPRGGAVHGMCGFHAARTARRSVTKRLLKKP